MKGRRTEGRAPGPENAKDAMEHRKQPVSPEVALASDVFDKLCSANTLKTILGFHRHLCELLHLKPGPFPQFYFKLKVLVFYFYPLSSCFLCECRPLMCCFCVFSVQTTLMEGPAPVEQVRQTRQSQVLQQG